MLKDTIRRDMREIAEEISATAAAESLGMTTELAKREARITQLGSRIEDLQVQLCIAHSGPLFSRCFGFLFSLRASGGKPRQMPNASVIANAYRLDPAVGKTIVFWIHSDWG